MSRREDPPNVDKKDGKVPSPMGRSSTLSRPTISTTARMRESITNGSSPTETSNSSSPRGGGGGMSGRGGVSETSGKSATGTSGSVTPTTTTAPKSAGLSSQSAWARSTTSRKLTVDTTTSATSISSSTTTSPASGQSSPSSRSRQSGAKSLSINTQTASPSGSALFQRAKTSPRIATSAAAATTRASPIASAPSPRISSSSTPIVRSTKAPIASSNQGGSTTPSTIPHATSSTSTSSISVRVSPDGRTTTAPPLQIMTTTKTPRAEIVNSKSSPTTVGTTSTTSAAAAARKARLQLSASSSPTLRSSPKAAAMSSSPSATQPTAKSAAVKDGPVALSRTSQPPPRKVSPASSSQTKAPPTTMSSSKTSTAASTPKANSINATQSNGTRDANRPAGPTPTTTSRDNLATPLQRRDKTTTPTSKNTIAITGKSNRIASRNDRITNAKESAVVGTIVNDQSCRCACSKGLDACLCMDCVCSDELCHCKAFQLVHSLQGNNTVGNASPARNGTVAEFSITGMTCAMCSQAIERAVRTVRGVESVQVSLVTDTATVQWQDVNDTGGSTGRGRTRDSIVQSIEDIGYQVTSVVVLSRSSSANNTGSNGHGDSNQNPSSSVAERWQLYRRNQYNKVRERRAAALWAMVATLPIVVWTMILPHVLPHVTDNWRVRLPQWLPVSSHSLHVDTLAVWILATLVQFICGWDFYKSAWYGFRNQTAGMDLLIVLGTTASYGYATSGVIWNSTAEDAHAMHFFETSTVLIVLVLVGKWMQAAAIRQTSDALTQLMELQSTTAVRITPQEVPNNQGSPRSASGRGNVPQREQRPSFNPLIDPYVEEVVSIEHVSVGDVVKVLRGASVPADGIVLFGEMAVDESMMTGESFPVLKTRGSVVLGGTICVDSGENGGEESDEQPPSVGAAFVQITGVGSSTALAQMVQLVQQAQTRAVPIQAFADRVSAVFVPAVCLISLVTYLVWYALCSTNVVPSRWYRDDLGEDSMTFSLKFAIACLVISCPCALGLATPTAVMVGTGVSARLGVLMKGGAALETGSQVDTVVFDKTGTLTKGRPAVSEMHHFTNDGRHVTNQGDEDFQTQEDYLLWLFGSLERTSEHPLARAIVSFATDKLGDAIAQNPFVHPTNFRAVTGRGASGMIMGKIAVAIGNRSFATFLGLSIPRDVDACMKRIEESGKAAVLGAVDGKVCCVLGVADELKPDAVASIMYLRETMGMDIWMVTGDNIRTAAAIGCAVGIHNNRIVAEALPAAKLDRIVALQAEGRVVCMVGDGINDSAALAQADVGIGMGTTGSAEIAMEAADIVLVKGNVADVCTALHLSRAIFRRIQWNLMLSLVYNCMGIPIAAGAFYSVVRTRLPPTVAAVAMALSSISVVLSSLSLRFYRPPKTTDVLRRLRRSRQPPRSSVQADDNDMRASLLSNDHLEASDVTIRTNNRTAAHGEEV